MRKKIISRGLVSKEKFTAENNEKIKHDLVVYRTQSYVAELQLEA